MTAPIPVNAAQAVTFFARLRGWMGKTPAPGDALLIKPCSAVHTMFMKVPIDVVFVDGGNRVLRIVSGLPPWRLSPRVRGAGAVLELTAGRARELGLKPGDIIE